MADSIGATPDKPLPTPFGFKSTAIQVVDAYASEMELKDRTVLVTGANSGIGRETARAFAHGGAKVVIACRSVEKGNAAAEEIRSTEEGAEVTVMELDLADLNSVKKFADEYTKSGLPLHYLINNAGVMAIQERQETKDGFEMQLGTNHVGHFVLTNLLVPVIAKTAGANKRIVNVSSGLHKRGVKAFDVEDLNCTTRAYGPFEQYGVSKIANIYFSLGLQERLKQSKATEDIETFSLHPGVINTELTRHLNWFINKVTPVLSSMGSLVGYKSEAQGAATTTFAAIAPGLNGKGGGYLADCNLTVPKLGKDWKERVSGLWEWSVQSTGVDFPKF
eukprot:Clim_evm13s226 gene=Clim_evmTU13s226